MKKLSLLILTILSGYLNSIAQQNDQNFVKSMVAREAIKSDLDTGNKSRVQQSIQYIDGIGRLKQDVLRQGAPNGKDVITPVGYDSFGRQVKDYLPYVSNATSLVFNTNGNFRPNALQEHGTFHNAHYGTSDGNFAFSQQKYENSPLNRVLEKGAPGAAWKINGNHQTTHNYRANTTAETVKRFSINTGNTILVGQDYTAGELWVVHNQDENTGAQEGIVVEYTDKRGRTLLKTVKENASHYLKTYYIYDDQNQLRSVVPPAGVAEIESATTPNWSLVNSVDFQEKWMFSYEYDSRGRMIAKRVPGSDWMYMIYDRHDRLVLTQEGNQRAGNVEEINGHVTKSEYEGKSYQLNSGSSLTLADGFEFTSSASSSFEATSDEVTSSGRWVFTKYDHLNRPVLSGFYQSNLDRVSLQALVDVQSDLTEKYLGTAGTFQGYGNSAFPTGISVDDLLSVTYYDNYDFTNEIPPSGALTLLKGQATGGKTRVLNTPNWLETVTFFDDRYRPIKVITQNHKGGLDILESTYRNKVSGLVATTVMRHTSDNYSGVLTVTETFQYDHMDRLLIHTHQVNSDPEVVLAHNSYNEVSELETKTIGNGLQDIDYQYNIRGWLTKINNGATLAGKDQFGMELQYDAAGQYNGNIGKIKWKTLGGSDESAQEYAYLYDPLSRLKKATYKSSNALKNGHFDVFGGDDGKIGYDANGNIQSISRKYQGNNLDLLTYAYEGNRLIQVEDTGNEGLNPGEIGFKDVNSLDGTEEYQYDANGNMVSDLNKGISSITYNHLNLPELVTFNNGNYVRYLYDAGGIKLQKESKTGANTTITDYLAGKHYVAGELSSFQHAGGRVVKNANSFEYEYHLTDHLGNVRATVKEAGTSTSGTLDQHVDNNSYDLNGSSQDFVIFTSAKTGDQVNLSLQMRELLDDDGEQSATAVAEIIQNGVVLASVEAAGPLYQTYTLSDVSIPAIGSIILRIKETNSESAIFRNISTNLSGITPDVAVVQVDDYYPFGLTFNSTKSGMSNNYLFNQGKGKVKFAVERQFDLGVDFTKRRVYDYSTGRFWQIDPLADTAPQESISSYHYSFNNPISFNDPYGEMGSSPINGEGIVESIRHKLHQANQTLNKVGESLEDVGNSLAQGASNIAEGVVAATNLVVQFTSDVVDCGGCIPTGIIIVGKDGPINEDPNSRSIKSVKNVFEVSFEDLQAVFTVLDVGLGQTQKKQKKSKLHASGSDKGQTFQEMAKSKFVNDQQAKKAVKEGAKHAPKLLFTDTVDITDSQGNIQQRNTVQYFDDGSQRTIKEEHF